jgi:hypothetical protein
LYQTCRKLDNNICGTKTFWLYKSLDCLPQVDSRRTSVDCHCQYWKLRWCLHEPYREDWPYLKADFHLCLHGEILSPHEGLACEFLLKWTICAYVQYSCQISRPTRRASPPLPVAFIWEISSPTRRDVG